MRLKEFVTIPVTKPKKNISGVPLWSVTIAQTAKVGGNFINEFTMNVRAETEVLARQAALKELDYWGGQAPIHYDRQEFMKLQRRDIHKLSWRGARSTITSIKRVKER